MEETQAVVEQEQVEQEPIEQENVAEETTGEEGTAPPAEEVETRTVPLKALEEERRKRQEMEKRLEEIEARTQAPQQQAQKTIYDFYEENPNGVMDYLNKEIAKLAEEDPYSNALQIEQLRDQKAELRAWGMNRQTEKANSFKSELNQAIPDFDKNKANIERYAITELGYTREELNTLTNPGIVGQSAAIKNAKLLTRQYEAANATTTIKSKEVTPKPTEVEQPGEGMKSPAPDAKLQKLYQECKQGKRPWHEYFTAAGI